jgi:hypothetical protein
MMTADLSCHRTIPTITMKINGEKGIGKIMV